MSVGEGRVGEVGVLKQNRYSAQAITIYGKSNSQVEHTRGQTVLAVKWPADWSSAKKEARQLQDLSEATRPKPSATHKS